MTASFLGSLSAAEALPTANETSLPITAISSGFFGTAPSVDTWSGHGLVCLTAGNARFDGELALQAKELGQAAAWAGAFLRHGPTAAATVRGRFAAVILNTDERTVWLATDRFGTYPLCYTASDTSFSFSDRADCVPGRSGDISPQAIFNYLFFHCIPAPFTIFSNVYRLPAGHYALWKNGTLECKRWWTPAFEEPENAHFADRKEEFLSIVEQSVSRESEQNEAGAFLSGGTDSSTVSGMLTKVTGKPARTYSIGFDAAGYDEMEYARIASRHFGTDHHEYYVTPDDLLDGIPKVATHYDQPFGNSSAVPAWICAQRARQDGITRMLAGDGGDELFGGNTRYAKQRIFGVYDFFPATLRQKAIEPILNRPSLERLPFIKKIPSYIQQASVPMPDRLQMYNMLIRIGLDQAFEPAFLESISTEAPFSHMRETWNSIHANSPLNRTLAYDWKYTLADNDLPKVIGTAQLAGLDVGFPLLSDELVDFSLKLPSSWKLKGFQLRWFFKEALRDFLPNEIITKQKHGFGLPFGVWACEHTKLRALANDALNSFKNRGVVQPAFIDKLVSTLLPAHPGYYGEMVWILMMMELWMRKIETPRTRTADA